ncbi:MAG TPA: M20/M25/M40 family metallo-hydrolase [Conexibacter sp.]|nr:M20/M25/M40 family metallo-hydrolase [Conexibacter sp.]
MSLALQRAFAYADGHAEQHLRRLCDQLRQPTVSATGEGLREAAGRLREWLARLGFDARLLGDGSHPLVAGARRDVPGAPTVLLYGHYDVQPPGDRALWSGDPFEPRIADGRLYARGAADNKGQHVAQLLALETLLECDGELPCNVVVVLDGEEEIGSPQLAATVGRHRDLLAADVVIAADGPGHPDGRVRIIAGCRGCLSFELSVTTARRELHSGNWGGVAPNAAWELVRALAALRGADGALTVPGLEPDPARVGALRDAARTLPVDLDAVRADSGIERLDAPVVRGFHERLTAWPALSVNALAAGPCDPAAAGAAIPAHATARCDLRLVPGQEPEAAFAALERRLAEVAPEVRLRRTGGAMAPASSPVDSPLLARLEAAVARGQGAAPLVEPLVGGSLPLATWQQQLGCPAYVVTYANHDCATHAPEENITLDAFRRGIRSGIATLLAFGEAAP